MALSTIAQVSMAENLTSLLPSFPMHFRAQSFFHKGN